MKREEVVKNIMSTYKKFGVTEKEIEEQMEKAVKKVPFEVKKIKVILFLIKKYKKFISIFKI